MAQSVIMYIYGDDAMARVAALRDPMISRAVDLFSQQIYSPDETLVGRVIVGLFYPNYDTNA